MVCWLSPNILSRKCTILALVFTTDLDDTIYIIDTVAFAGNIYCGKSIFVTFKYSEKEWISVIYVLT